jgi:hypothetical protein
MHMMHTLTLQSVCLPACLPACLGTPAAAATVFGTPESGQSSHSGATTGPLTLSEFSLDCYLFPGGLSHCLGPGQGGQSYPRMFFSFWFVIGPWAATLQPSKLAGTAGPATTDATRPVGNSAVSKYSKSFSVNCNLYADNTHFCFTTPPAPFSERAAGMFLQIAYEANATAAATAHEVPAREGSLFHRGLHVTSSGPGAFAAPAATNDNRQTVTSARSDRYTDDPKWIVECYVSADGTLLCLQPSGGQGTPTAHIRLDLTLAGAAMQAASDTGEPTKALGNLRGGGAQPLTMQAAH